MTEDSPATLQAELVAMAAEVARAPDLAPGSFWTDLAAKNVAMLQADGLARFKRTVSQNYFNWLITSPRHPFFRSLLRQWRARPDPALLLTRPEADIVLRTMVSDVPVRLSRWQRWSYGWFVGLVWAAMRRHDALGLAARLDEPLAGDPIRITQGRRLISQDLANSIVEFNTLAPFLAAGGARPRIAEIGAGYGRLAHVAVAGGNARHAIFDIPPALAVAQWYLPRVLPGRTIFRFRPFDDFAAVRAEAEAADVLLLSANQIRLFPDGWFDAALSISTLPEMPAAQARLYLAEMARLSRRAVFVKQWRDWTNEADGTRLGPDDYTPGPGFTLALDRTDPITPDFFNRVWVRSAS
jgi:putative sugar O-methyltransferase